jgi:hypothetical protein
MIQHIYAHIGTYFLVLNSFLFFFIILGNYIVRVLNRDEKKIKSAKKLFLFFSIPLMLSILIQYSLESYFFADISIYSMDKPYLHKFAYLYMISIQPLVITIFYLYKKGEKQFT